MGRIRIQLGGWACYDWALGFYRSGTEIVIVKCWALGIEVIKRTVKPINSHVYTIYKACPEATGSIGGLYDKECEASIDDGPFGSFIHDSPFMPNDEWSVPGPQKIPFHPPGVTPL